MREQERERHLCDMKFVFFSLQVKQSQITTMVTEELNTMSEYRKKI